MSLPERIDLTTRHLSFRIDGDCLISFHHLSSELSDSAESVDIFMDGNENDLCTENLALN